MWKLAHHTCIDRPNRHNGKYEPEFLVPQAAVQQNQPQSNPEQGSLFSTGPAYSKYTEREGGEQNCRSTLEEIPVEKWRVNSQQ